MGQKEELDWTLGWSELIRKIFKHLIFFALVWKSCILVLLTTCHNIIHVELFFMLPQHKSRFTQFRLGNSYKILRN